MAGASAGRCLRSTWTLDEIRADLLDVSASVVTKDGGSALYSSHPQPLPLGHRAHKPTPPPITNCGTLLAGGSGEGLGVGERPVDDVQPPVAPANHLGVVGGDQDGRPPVSGGEDGVERLCGVGGILLRRRLVGEQDVGPPGNTRSKPS
jgi:hypothetical protein